MTPPSSLFFFCNVIFLLSFVVFADCKNVYYVPQSACSVSACNFSDPTLWTPSPPSPGDDVFISSYNLSVSLFASNSSLSLSSLSFGVGNSSSVVFALDNTSFTVSKVLWMGQSKLIVENGSRVNADSLNGTFLTVNSGELNADLAYVVFAKFNSSVCSGGDWKVSNGEFSANSSFSLSSLVAFNLTSMGSTWVIDDTFEMVGAAKIMGGNLSIGSLVVSDTFDLISTTAYISVLTFANSATSFFVDGSESPAALFIGSLPADCSSPISQRMPITLNASVTASFNGGSICNLSVSDGVTLNFGTTEFELYGVQQAGGYLNTFLQINLLSSQLTLNGPLFLSANVSILRDAVLIAQGDITMYGDILGNGKIYANNSVVSAEHISVSEIHLNGTGGLTAHNAINTTYLSFESMIYATYTIDAPSVRISEGPGIFVQSNNFIYFGGDLILRSGIISVGSKDLINFTTPYLVVKGNAIISNTTVVGDMPENAKKLFIVQSTSKQLASSDSAAEKHRLRITVSSEYIILERNIPAGFGKYLPLTLVIVGGLPFVCAAAIVISILKYKRKYARLP